MSKLVAFEQWRSGLGEQSAFMQRVAEGEPPREICAKQGLPYSMLMRHVKATPGLYAEYKAALETWVEALAHETVALADGVKGAEEAATVAAAKLAVDTRFRLASKLYREMFGEDVRAPLAVVVNLGNVAEEIRSLEARLGIGGAIEGAALVEQEWPKPVLPAPANPGDGLI